MNWLGTHLGSLLLQPQTSVPFLSLTEPRKVYRYRASMDMVWIYLHTCDVKPKFPPIFDRYLSYYVFCTFLISLISTWTFYDSSYKHKHTSNRNTHTQETQARTHTGSPRTHTQKHTHTHGKNKHYLASEYQDLKGPETKKKNTFSQLYEWFLLFQISSTFLLLKILV